MRAELKNLLQHFHLEEFARGVLGSTRRATGRLAMSVGSDAKAAAAYFLANDVRKLHIGCGAHVLHGWLNTDFVRSREVLFLDATRPFPFGDSEFDYVYSEHMIEHISFPAGQRFLKECSRILKPGGKIRVATPDLMFLVDLCRDGTSTVQRDYIEWSSQHFVPEAPFPSEAFVVNNFFRDWGHRFIYNDKVLRASMEAAGFVNVRRCELNASDDAQLRNLEHDSRMPRGFLELETFVLEGIKPRP
jgi:predicted SAM-dependent methyltransferase